MGAKKAWAKADFTVMETESPNTAIRQMYNTCKRMEKK